MIDEKNEPFKILKSEKNTVSFSTPTSRIHMSGITLQAEIFITTKKQKQWIVGQVANGCYSSLMIWIIDSTYFLSRR